MPAEYTPQDAAMIRISSRTTIFYKWALPAMWFGILGFLAFHTIHAALAQQQFAKLLPAFGIITLMAIFGYFIMSMFVFDLVDEVWDCGESILVRNKGHEYRFSLSDFTNLGYAGFSNPPRVTLSLREASDDLGNEIAFMPPLRVFPFSTPPFVRDLILRIDEARRLM